MRSATKLDVMRSTASASNPSDEGPPLSFSSSSGGDAWATDGASEADEPSLPPAADAAAAG
ncbi:hypothetical protein PC116_g26711 [Phytophthora cactorum]|uniref:Uncharacterized protein n=1 Tax=Phytophthora cactorum TaxID=29920 RepID=A0A8T1AX71_9STRA|nr:hypothetical protein Pcac1_g27696 [Phytophthora cactorum]KAG2873909.1 hypothetical protein PC114_g25587 [Phytophthora cactorum]KAG2888765.1 hypothetical protein PC117_g24840 [Phytophthora cactorum]KAG2966704.1 hypothetical protein PC119_g24665 [Phytophthora cactorum]KAG3130173.1 hypothetical protein C6341_g23853 [Phytophthora cactorum]